MSTGTEAVSCTTQSEANEAQLKANFPGAGADFFVVAGRAGLNTEHRNGGLKLYAHSLGKYNLRPTSGAGAD